MHRHLHCNRHLPTPLLLLLQLHHLLEIPWDLMLRLRGHSHNIGRVGGILRWLDQDQELELVYLYPGEIPQHHDRAITPLKRR